MNEQEKARQKKRVDSYELFDQAADELTVALDLLRACQVFSGDTSKVRAITSITIKTDFAEAVTLDFCKARVTGWSLKNAFAPILEESRNRLWREMERL
jgi:hypothetical protein